MTDDDVEYVHADIAARAREDALRDVGRHLEAHAPHLVDGPEYDVGYFHGYKSAVARLMDILPQPDQTTQRMDVAEAAPDLSDAYVGAMEDKRMWRRRALEAEAKLRALAGETDHD